MPLTITETPADHMPEEFTVEGLLESGLTEAEVELLTSGDDPVTEAAKPDDDPADAAKPKEDDIPGGEIGGSPEDLVAQQQAQQEPQSPPQEPIQAEPEQPIKLEEIPDVSQAEALIADIDKQLEAITDRYDEGDMTKSEFMAEQKKLASEQAKAQRDIDKAAEVMQRNKEAIESEWFGKLEAFKETNPGLWEPEHVQNWDAFLRHVTSPENAGIYGNMSRQQQIDAAFNLYSTEYERQVGKPLSVGKPKPEPKGKTDGDAGDGKIKPRADERPDPPVTLAGVNGDGAASLDDGTFAAIDRRIDEDPLLGEAAFERMTEEQQQRYLAG